MIFKLHELNNYSSELLKLLTKNINNLLQVKDLEGKHIYTNQAICDKLLMAKDTNEAIGKDNTFFTLREQKNTKISQSGILLEAYVKALM